MIIWGYRAGIEENINHPAQCFDKSIEVVKEIQDEYKKGCTKLIFVASSCVYGQGEDIAQPYTEDSLGLGRFEETNIAHARADACAHGQCVAYNREYGVSFITAVVADVYGSLTSSHFIMQLMKRMHEAKVKSLPEVTIWGDGSAVRHPIYYRDANAALQFVLENFKGDVINVAPDASYSIGAVARVIQEVVGYRGPLVFDCSKPTGAARKVLDNGKLKSLGFTKFTNLMDGLEETYSNLVSSLSARA